MDEIKDTSGVQPTAPVSAETETKGETPVADPIAALEAKLRTEFLTKLEEKDRHWQSVKDKEVKVAREEANKTKRKLATTEASLSAINELANKNPQIQAALLTAQERARQQESVLDAQDKFSEAFYTNITEAIKDLGVDPNDPKIDWAYDGKDAFDSQRRILASVAKINAEKIKSLEAKQEEIVKDALAKFRKEAGIDTVDTATSSAAASDKEFMKKMANYELPMTKENLARLKKIQDSY